MSFSKNLAAEYQLYFDDNFNRYRRNVRKVRRGKYTADDWSNDWAGMWLGALELAVRPYNFVLRRDDSRVSKRIPLTRTTESIYQLYVYAPGTAMSATVRLTESSGTGKYFNAAATTVPRRDCVVLTIPPLSGPAKPPIVFIKDELYKGEIVFVGSTDAAAKVRIRVA